MKKSIINIFLLIVMAPFLVQCASQSDVEELRYQLRIVNKKLEDMKSTTVAPLQKSQAAASGQMDNMEKKILELKEQLEETRHLNQRLKDQNKELEKSIANISQEEAAKREEALKHLEEQQREQAKLAEKLNQQQESVKAMQEARLKEAERKAKDTALAAELAKKKTQTATSTSQPDGESPKQSSTPDKKKAKTESAAASENTEQPSKKQTQAIVEKTAEPTVAATPSSGSEDSDNTLKKAQKLFDKNSFAEALPLFEQVAKNTGSKDSIEARYMMGECLFNQKEYDKAIMQYQKIISQSPGHGKAPSAMLKQGMSFEKLSDKETAKVIYKKLLKKHASSQEAGKAQERLGKL